MDQKKLLKWMCRTEVWQIRRYENNNGYQSLVLVANEKNGELFRRTYRPDYPDFSDCLKKNSWWKRLLLGQRYTEEYKKTTTIAPYKLVVKETIGDNVIWQADVEKTSALAQMIAESDKKLVFFRRLLKTCFSDMDVKAGNKMYPLQDFLYRELCHRHPEKQTGLEYIRILLCRCCQEHCIAPDFFEGVKNPLEYLYAGLDKGFPFESIVYGYAECVYAGLYKVFFGDVKALSNLLDCSGKMILQLDGGIDDCRSYMRFPKFLDIAVDYLEC